MSVNVKNYKSFEQLESDVCEMDKSWKKASANKNKAYTFAEIQKRMQASNLFIINERKDLNKEIDKLKDVWSGKVVAERREKLNAQFDTLVENIVEATKQDIATLSNFKLEKIDKMITTAPTEDQLRLLSALQMRGDVDTTEVHHILPMFFNNYQSMRVLQAISEQNGINLYLPVQLDCCAMYDTLSEATSYLLSASEQLSKNLRTMPVQYHAFYTVNPENKDKDEQYDPYYQKYIDMFDNVPQLQGVKTEKKRLSEVEKTRLNWYFKDVADLDETDESNKLTIAHRVEEVIATHPEVKELILLSHYYSFMDTDND